MDTPGEPQKSTERETTSEAASVNKPEPLLTPADLADYLGVPIKTLYTWRYHHEGPPALRIGRHLRFRRRDVEDWLHDRLDPALPHLR